jgi:glutaredoxin
VTTLIIYSRPGCHLCDDMKAVVTRVAQAAPIPFATQEIDISTDPELEALYGTEIPVLVVNGRKAAKYRIGEDELRRILSARAPVQGSSFRVPGSRFAVPGTKEPEP